jgi:UDP-N-acetylglucosamine diphosphorylase / glucose-1-phosphate thymidylyltransferase / UDP-N-acetylgalactosamine diphosphorylase / glucosamine-1-phosphate N-acetyltransferase / galactosamine-1-phosphate N-acetyltransferase
MQAVILAAGRGTRMGELTQTRPKPLLEVAGKSLIEYELDILPDEVDEVIIIVGYLGHMIQQKLGGAYKGKRLLYVEQDVLDGTAGSLWRAAALLKDRFLVLMSDDLYSKEDAQKIALKEDWAMLAQYAEHMNPGGRIVTNEDGTVERIEEGDHEGESGLAGTNFFILDTRLFDYPMVPKKEGSSEFGLPQTVIAASKRSGIPFRIEPTTFWFQISDASDIQKAEAIIAGN